MSHRRRVSLNEQLNRLDRHADAVLVKAVQQLGPNEAQDMLLWPGILVMGCMKTGPVQNGVFYEVEAVDDESVSLVDGPTLTHFMAARNLRLTYALTYASCQGLTLDGRVRLWDTQSPNFTKRHLFVAMSRATSADNLEIA